MDELKNRLLVFEAKRWLGVVEQGGDNQGQIVQMFQSVIGTAQGESWCVSFVQYCAKMVDQLCKECGLSSTSLQIAKTESVMQLWNKTPIGFRTNTPSPGCLMLWEHYKSGMPTGLGHVGIVVGVKNNVIETVEGNTSPSLKNVERNGDGVYLKQRTTADIGSMRFLGFLRVW